MNKIKWCIEWEWKEEDKAGWTNLDGTPAVWNKHDYEWFDSESEALTKAEELLNREDVTKVVLTEKTILKG